MRYMTDEGEHFGSNPDNQAHKSCYGSLDNGSRWQWVGASPDILNDPTAKKLREEGLDSAPKGFRDDQKGPLLPRQTLNAKCRLCGMHKKLTREHIPPQASGNNQTTVSHSFTSWSSTDDLSLPDHGPIEQGGIKGYTLCADCNSITGRLYGAEYQKWVELANKELSKLLSPIELDKLVEPQGWNLRLGQKDEGGVKPGAFVRQIL